MDAVVLKLEMNAYILHINSPKIQLKTDNRYIFKSTSKQINYNVVTDQDNMHIELKPCYICSSLTRFRTSQNTESNIILDIGFYMLSNEPMNIFRYMRKSKDMSI
jgi:hypothetical protein